MTDKDKIKGQANIDITNLRIAQEQGIITEFGRGKLEALEGIVDFIDSLQEEPVREQKLSNVQRIGKNWKEEPVSEDLEKVSKEWLHPQLDKSYEKYGEDKMMELTRFDGYAMLEAIEFGAKWKEEQFEKNRLKHCNSITNEQAELEQKFVDEHLDKYDRMPTYLDAIEYGMMSQKEQMMEQAIDGTARPDDAEVWCNLDSFNFNDGDKVKVIVIKED